MWLRAHQLVVVLCGCCILLLASLSSPALGLSDSYLKDDQEARKLKKVACPTNERLRVVHSKYHGEDHCLCPTGFRCIGTMCSTGQSSNGGVYHHEIHGFHFNCTDCECFRPRPRSDFDKVRQDHELWIIGAHHKTGSFLSMRLWGGLHTLVQPSLKVKVVQFRPMSEEQWKKLDSNVDVLVLFHSKNISKHISEITHRPYKFVHIIRDPIESIISAFLYEKQRIGLGVHDSFHKLVRNKIKISEDEALHAMATAMLPALLDMEEQYLLAEKDHQAINIKLEDFSSDFNDTVLRMFKFLEVPKSALPTFMEAAQRENLDLKPFFANESSHVTSGKYDKHPLAVKLFCNPIFRDIYVRIKSTLKYSCCPVISCPNSNGELENHELNDEENVNTAEADAQPTNEPPPEKSALIKKKAKFQEEGYEEQLLEPQNREDKEEGELVGKPTSAASANTEEV